MASAKPTASMESWRAWKGLDRATAGLIERLLGPLASTLRAGAVITQELGLRNFVRDLQYAFVTSKGLFSPIDMAKGVIGLIAKDVDFRNWQAGGGANISMVSLDR